MRLFYSFYTPLSVPYESYIKIQPTPTGNIIQRNLSYLLTMPKTYFNSISTKINTVILHNCVIFNILYYVFMKNR